MLNRNKKGKLVLKSLDLEIFIGELYEKCKTEKEVNWLEEQLQPMIKCLAEERINELD